MTLLLAGAATACGGDTAASPGASEASTSEQSAAPEATVEQYASIVARNRELGKQLKAMGDCDWLGSGPLDPPGYFVCDIGLLTMSYQAQTIGPALSAASNPARDSYVGEPPAEIVDLVAETKASAAVLAKTAHKAHARDCGQQSGAGACMDLRIDAWKAMGNMQSALAAWGPYI